MKQNVNGTTAAVVIALALVIFFVVFSKWGKAPPEPPPFVLPDTPEVQPGEIQDMYQGLSPLGIAVVVPPLAEDTMRGVRISGVERGGLAESAGVRMGDLLIKFDGRPVGSKETLIFFLTQVNPQKTYSLVAIRGGKEITLKVSGLRPLAPESQVRQ